MEMLRTERARTTAGALLRGMVVVLCYLIVFAGLLLTVAGAGVP